MEEKKIAICADQITKIYKLYEKPSDRMREALGLTRRKLHKEHYALQGVDMTVYQGDTVEVIGNNAFYGCSNLSELTSGNSISSIGSSAFFNCTSLTSVYPDICISRQFWNSHDFYNDEIDWDSTSLLTAKSQ